MKIGELIDKLSAYDRNTEVVVMTSHDDGDDITDWEILHVHDGFDRKIAHDLVSITIDLGDYYK